MTTSKFLLAKILKFAGIAPIDRYRTEAANENQLMTESEVILGELCWESVENVPELGTEYWRIRSLVGERNKLSQQVDSLQEAIDKNQEARNEALQQAREAEEEQGDAPDDVLAKKIGALQERREEIQKTGRTIKRDHLTLKSKLEVLVQEGLGQDSIAHETRQALSEKRDEFAKVREQRDRIDQKLAELQQEYSRIAKSKQKKSEVIKMQAEEQYGEIGKMNQELTTLRSNLAHLTNQCNELFTVIGRYMITYYKTPEVQRLSHKYKKLLKMVYRVRLSSFRLHRIIGQ